MQTDQPNPKNTHNETIDQNKYDSPSSSQMPKASGAHEESSNILLSIIGIFAILYVVLSIIFFIVILAIGFSLESDDNPTSDNQASSNNSEEEVVNTADWVKIDRKCYSFKLTPDNDADKADSSCELSVKYGKEKVAGISVLSFIYPDKGLAENIKDWKGNPITDTQKIISEQDIKVGGIDANKIVYTLTDSNSEAKSAIIFVDSGKTYVDNKVPLKGFIIQGAYDEEFSSEEIFDKAIESWQWK